MKKAVNKIVLGLFLILTASNIAHAQESPIVGTWTGILATAWAKPYNVKFEFKKDGTYSSLALESTCLWNGDRSHCSDADMPALYYGSDGEHEKKKYRLKADGKTGSIDIYFGNTSGSILTLDFLNMNIKGDVMEFSLKHPSAKFPMAYSLKRQNIKK